MLSDVFCDRFNFGLLSTPVTTGTASENAWKKALTGSATCARGTSGFMELALTSTNEAQMARLYFDDFLPYNIDLVQQIDIWVSLSANFAGTFSFGAASAANATIENISHFALFKCVGNNSIVLSTDDNVNDNTDVASGITLSTQVKKFTIDFEGPVITKVGAPSVAGKANVQFFGMDDRFNSRLLNNGRQFDMSQYAGGLQPYFQIQKATGTGTGIAIPRRMDIKYKLAA